MVWISRGLAILDIIFTVAISIGLPLFIPQFDQEVPEDDGSTRL